MIQVLSGVLITASSVSALFFLRFWRQTRDRLFAVFAAAFFFLALNWVGLAIYREQEVRTYFYTLRLAAFGLILWGIWQKNRRGPGGT